MKNTLPGRGALDVSRANPTNDYQLSQLSARLGGILYLVRWMAPSTCAANSSGTNDLHTLLLDWF
jgi:hypothetical protein